jgi:hypothetical protein
VTIVEEGTMLRIISALVAATIVAPEPAGADGCYANWSVAAPIVQREGLATVEALSQLAQSKISGHIVKTTLCEEESGYVYRLLIRDSAGRLTNHKVDARAPFAR